VEIIGLILLLSTYPHTFSVCAWVRGEDSVMDEIVFRHGEDEFRERFEVKEQIGVGGK